jgi:putative iron-regulated protein
MIKNGLSILAIASLLVACKPNETTVPNFKVSSVSVTVQYADVAYNSYKNALSDAEKLKTAIDAFVSEPSSATFGATKAAWLTARVSYGYTEGFRFYGGPIDNATNGPEGLLNSWPMDESYVDYVSGNTVSGIINNVSGFPSISAETIKSANQPEVDGGETNVSTGYHAIEFLLWGQDNDDNGSGTRPYTDYLPTSLGGTAMNQIRRGQYLKSLAELLVADLQILVSEWDANVTSNYRSNFIKESETQNSLKKILKGLGTFSKGEFGGERMGTAYDTQDQEDEHSCFSDNTTKEFSYWQISIDNLYHGNYFKPDGTKMEGMGIDDMIKERNRALYDSSETIFSDTKSKIASIPDPFDQAIKNKDSKIKAAINSLSKQGDQFVRIGEILGLTVANDYCIDGVDCK